MKESDKVIELIKLALKEVYKNDKYLIDNKISERAIVSKFACYFSQMAKDSPFKNFDIDVEYNRQGIKSKIIGEKLVCIDFIVHERGNNNDNLIAIEFKPYWNKNKKAIEKDKQKIKDLCDHTNKYRYKYGFVLTFEKEFEKIIVDLQ
ncbi:MAG: hypothetical protein J6V90_11150 [Treponema sp.]|nr:hypothetical protein [Treponema sp.]